MDIARSMVLSNKPLKRLDAATFGTMGVGLGQAISAALTYPEDKIVLIQGDSAFGFSAMDVETIARYKLNVAIYILNNNGITRGVDKIEEGQSPDPVCLLPGSKYELMADAFGGRGYSIETIPRLIEVCKEVNSYKGVTIANIKIDPYGGRRPQSFEWLTTSKL